jgi:hypothetical protein
LHMTFLFLGSRLTTSSEFSSQILHSQNLIDDAQNDNSESFELLRAVGALTSLRTAPHFSESEPPLPKRHKVESSSSILESSPTSPMSHQFISSNVNILDEKIFMIKALR